MVARTLRVGVQAAQMMDGPGGVPEWRPEAYLTVTGDSIASDGIYLLENAAEVRSLHLDTQTPPGLMSIWLLTCQAQRSFRPLSP